MHRVLVVEDDADIREVLAESLRRRGYDVTVAVDGQDALDWLADDATTLPDAIVLDLMMPRVDGWAFCERVRVDPKLSRIPVIAMSAFGSNIHLPHATAFLPKPFEADELDALLRRVAA